MTYIKFAGTVFLMAILVLFAWILMIEPMLPIDTLDVHPWTFFRAGIAVAIAAWMFRNKW